MRRLIALGAALLFSAVAFAGNAAAAQAAPPWCDAHYFGLGNGEGIAVYCGLGPSDRFRVIAFCDSGIGSWSEYGTIGYSGSESSEARCRGLVVTPHVAGY